MRKRQQLSGPSLLWVTVRNEDTTELLNSWSYRDRQQAEAKKMEQEEALDPPGIQTVVDYEWTHMPGELPPKFKKK